jgi:carbon dioxide concentrating mechanism protein CcmL
MIIAQIVGTVVSTRKDEKLEGLKFYVARELNAQCKPTGREVIAVDIVGAGLNEIVLCAQGSSARQSPQTDGKPVDAAVMAIIDTMNVDGTPTYVKE